MTAWDGRGQGNRELVAARLDFAGSGGGSGLGLCPLAATAPVAESAPDPWGAFLGLTCSSSSLSPDACDQAERVPGLSSD